MMLGRILTVLVAAFTSYSNGDQESCLRFGGGACCPVVNPLGIPLNEELQSHPVYYSVFYPSNEASYNLDNVCITLFPVPDDSNTHILYFSRVYNDGSNDIKSFMLTEVEPGVRRLGSSLCQFTDTEFNSFECDTDVSLLQRCETYGSSELEPEILQKACTALRLVGSSGVFGVSSVRRPISIACLNKAKSAISNNGLPVDDYIILPMKLPSRCVLNQVCSIASNLQRFCQTVGVAFPTVNNNYCVNQYY